MYSNELYHYGVKGMKWGVRRKQYRNTVKTAKNRMYDKWNTIEDAHEDRLIKLNRKYGQLGNNVEGGNRKLTRTEKKSYKKEIGSEWDRYSKEMDKATSEYKATKKQAKQDAKNYGKSEDHLRAKQLKQKNLNQLSNAELKELNNRMQLESQYKNLKRQNVNAGQKFVKDVAYETSKQIASEYTKKYAKKGISYIGDLRK